MKSMDVRPIELSVISPLYNEEDNIWELHKRLTLACKAVTNDYEIILVNDGSSDNTQVILEKIAREDNHLKYIKFSRNFGHQNALSAGLDHVNGHAVVIIDGDLQDPPELIPDLYAQYKKGYDVVYAKRAERMGESYFKLISAKWFYRVLNKLTTVKIPLDTGDFRLISRNVVQSLRKLNEKGRFLRGQVAWVGFPQIEFEYHRDGRKHGETKYSLKHMIKLALDGITSFSNLPLRLSTWLGFASSVLSLIVIMYVFYSKYILGGVITGWTSIMVSILFMGGVQLICLGVLGEYIARIYSEVRNRPSYVIEKSNLEQT